MTAQHVVDGVDLNDLNIQIRTGSIDVGIEQISDIDPGADVAAFLLDRAITASLQLTPASENIILSQDAFFAGFPFGFGVTFSSVTYPFIKTGFVSGKVWESGIELWYLDGMNNPGFSGGPVVFNRLGTDEWQVAAVVSGYRTEKVSVAQSAGFVSVNTGLVLAYDVRYAVEAIDRYPM